VALVSLVAGDQQWFKARLGFPECGTDLNASVCVHAGVSPDGRGATSITQRLPSALPSGVRKGAPA
jgi:hypothetical protein